VIGRFDTPVDNVFHVHCIFTGMPDPSNCVVRFAEVLRDGVVITFSDGKSALFSGDFLRSSLSHAQELSESEEEDTND
jgi:hypothetical protein